VSPDGRILIGARDATTAEVVRRVAPGTEPAPPVVLAMLCALAEKPPVDVRRVRELAQQSVAAQSAMRQPVTGLELHALGLACYRAGEHEEAIRHLRDSMTRHPEGAAQVLNYQVLALACHRMGQDAEARRWRDKASEWIGPTAERIGEDRATAWPLGPQDLLEMWLLERELAQQTLGPKE
jgi:tetratricopeptide (TPR) repeat protein